MEMTHKKKLIFTIFLLTIALAGCKKSQKRVAPQSSERYEQETNMPLAQNDSSSVSIFDEGIEAFVLEEEVDNPFMQDAVTLAHNDGQELDISWEEPTHLKDEVTTVYFDYDSPQPLADQKLALEDLTKKAQAMYKNNRMVCVKGHSCKWHGTSVYNVALSMKRSNTIADYLMQAGIPTSHIKVFGVGNEEPIVFEDSFKGQAPNRRVEVYALAA